MSEKKPPSQPAAEADGPLVRRVTVLNRYGIHARPASLLVKAASRHPCEIYIEKEGLRVNAKSIMGLMMLAAGQGTKLVFRASGEDAAELLDDLEALFKANFNE